MIRLIILAIAAIWASSAYASQKLDRNGGYFPSFGYGSTTSVAYSGSQGSLPILAAGGAQYELVRIYTTSAAYIDIGAAPAAGSSKMPVAANTATIIEVISGQHIAAVQQSASGTMYITRLPMQH